MTNTKPAIIRRETREQITFVEIPSAETCKKLRQYGFDYDRRHGLWLKSEIDSTVNDEQTVMDSVAT